MHHDISTLALVTLILTVMAANRQILILGAGINGAALARELVLNGLNVVVADTADAASGTTAYSSRLIHGGLRYLEHGDFALVRESLAERTRLLRLAPQFVQPLELSIPVENRLGGAAAEVGRVLGLKRRARDPGAGDAAPPARGLWLVRTGLALYDRYARDRSLPRHSVVRAGDARAVAVDARRFRWICTYFDAQVLFPERLVLAFLEDARQAAQQQGLEFEVLTYHHARLHGNMVELQGRQGTTQMPSLQPAAIVNASGPWVDLTLDDLQIPSRRLMGGTKGSHLVTHQARLKELLAGRGLYAEAADGRPIFVLPLGAAVLIGTTDIPFEGDPREARTTQDEIDYLLRAVNCVLPQAELRAADIDLHYCGVRPLPHADATTPAAITRRHAIEVHRQSAVPVYSLVGGKLTTCRSFAEEAAGRILADLGLARTADSRDRLIPGAEGYPADDAAGRGHCTQLAERFRIADDQVRSIWALFGTRSEAVLASCDARSVEDLDGTSLPQGVARWCLRHEWAQTLADLVERRLMLLYHQPLTRRCLTQLAGLLVESGKLADDDDDAAVQSYVEDLAARYGKNVSTPQT